VHMCTQDPAHGLFLPFECPRMGQLEKSVLGEFQVVRELLFVLRAYLCAAVLGWKVWS
jgi:hypothetical protein